MQRSDTIIAVASPPGRSLRGIIRLSGEGVGGVIEAATDIAQGSQRGMYRARLRDVGDGSGVPCLAMIARGPASYTGEDTLELQLPGNPVLLERVVERLLESAAGCDVALRRAEPGEFTARAYFNGRPSLTQAEGVAATIAAVSDAQLRAATMLRSDALGCFAASLADDLAGALALVEAGIDFADEEDVVAIGPLDLRDRLERMIKEVEARLARAVGMEHLEAIPWVVLAGAPNAGKSTLFNALLGRSRAVVCETAGTTRDVLAEPLHVSTVQGDAEVMLVDVAGLDERDTTAMNRRMQDRAREAFDRAELIVRCVDATTRSAPAAHGVTPWAACSAITVRTKADLGPGGDGGEGLSVSAHTGDGLDGLRRAIAQRIGARAVSLAADTIALRPRHEAALRSARASLRAACELIDIEAGMRHLRDAELIAGDMRGGLDQLAALAGDITPDDVLGRVFASFCIGK